MFAEGGFAWSSCGEKCMHPWKSCIVGSICCSKISLNFSVLMLPTQTVNEHCQEQQPHTIAEPGF